METLNLQQVIFSIVVVWAIVYFILHLFFVTGVKDSREKQYKQIACLFWPVMVFVLPSVLLFYGVELIIKSILK